MFNDVTPVNQTSLRLRNDNNTIAASVLLLCHKEEREENKTIFLESI